MHAVAAKALTFRLAATFRFRFLMSTTLARNYFELLSVPQSYTLEREELDAHYRELQRSVHPDRFATASQEDRLRSVQQAASINEAYQVLKDPLQRGRYLLELRGIKFDEQQKTTQDPVFLMQQMEFRESLADVRGENDPIQALDKLSGTIRDEHGRLEKQLAQMLDNDDNEAALGTTLKMQFFIRLRNEVKDLQAELEDELY